MPKLFFSAFTVAADGCILKLQIVEILESGPK